MQRINRLSTEEILKELEDGSDVNTQDEFNRTYLMHSTLNRDFPLIKKLIELGADLELQDNSGETVLRLAIVFHIDKEIILYLIEHGANVNSANHRGVTPLIYTIYWNNISIANLLLDNGADINLSIGVDRLSPLMLALFRNRVELSYIFIDRGADINLVNSMGWNALIYAIILQDIFLIKKLLQRGAECNIVDLNGDNSLNFALRCRNPEIKTILIEFGAKSENREITDILLDKNETSLFGLNKKSIKVDNRRIDIEANTLFKKKKISIYHYQINNYPINIHGSDINSRELDSYKYSSFIHSNIIRKLYDKGYLSKNDIAKIKEKISYFKLSDEEKFSKQPLKAEDKKEGIRVKLEKSHFYTELKLISFFEQKSIFYRLLVSPFMLIYLFAYLLETLFSFRFYSDQEYKEIEFLESGINIWGKYPKAYIPYWDIEEYLYTDKTLILILSYKTSITIPLANFPSEKRKKDVFTIVRESIRKPFHGEKYSVVKIIIYLLGLVLSFGNIVLLLKLLFG